MKNFVLFVCLCFTLSCAERKQTDDISELLDTLENVDSMIEKEDNIESRPNAESFGLMGTWDIPSSFGGGQLTIEHHLGKYYKNEELSDGTVNISEMLMTEEGGLKIFRLKDGLQDETWTITEKGNLVVSDKNGLVYSTEPI